MGTKATAKNKMPRKLKKWFKKQLEVDECLDAKGFSTIRLKDDTESQPIATAYDPLDAELIVRAVNTHERLIAILKDCILTKKQYSENNHLSSLGQRELILEIQKLDELLKEAKGE